MALTERHLGDWGLIERHLIDWHCMLDSAPSCWRGGEAAHVERIGAGRWFVGPPFFLPNRSRTVPLALS